MKPVKMDMEEMDETGANATRTENDGGIRKINPRHHPDLPLWRSQRRRSLKSRLL